MSRMIIKPASRVLLGMLVFALAVHLFFSLESSTEGRLRVNKFELHNPFKGGLGQFNFLGKQETQPEGNDKDAAIITQLSSTPAPTHTPASPIPSPARANATFVILCRNGDLEKILQSMRQVEDRFNAHYNYPYVFLNEQPFTDNFKTRISLITSAPVEFGLIPREHWVQPSGIDEARATEFRNQLVKENVPYGGSIPYRNMCRFNSGFFFRHPLLLKYRWYWRVEPGVNFHCDINHDPFMVLQESKKTYGFTISLHEYMETIPTLWHHAKEFAKLHPEHVAENNSMDFLSKPDGSYNGCHFWSNFEVADMDFWRSPAYMAFFEYLDAQGGFYYERWGDAPVHSIAAALLLDRNQIHFFDKIGYEHDPFSHCPILGNNWREGRCTCDPAKSFDHHWWSCTNDWRKFVEPEPLTNHVSAAPY